MNIFTTSLLFLLQQLVSGVQGQDCAPIEQLGTASLTQFDYSISIDVDDDDEYTLQIGFKHDENLPSASNPPAQCDPSIVPPEIADDGLPYFAFRWHYESVPELVKSVTGIDHISIDYNACGHPPVNIFTTPHYDVHIYLVTTELRTCMTCKTIPGAPVCDPTPGEQTTPSGNAFFEWETVPGSEQPRNMPAGFEVGVHDMVPLMGGHSWNFAKQPANFLTWTEPFWIMGTYGGSITNYEPMIPMAFMSGPESKVYEESLVYEDHTMKELPSMYCIDYNALTGVVNMTFKGKSLVGALGGKSAKHSKKTTKAPKTKKPKSTKAPKSTRAPKNAKGPKV